MSDRKLFLTVVLIMGAALLASIVGITVLAVLERAMPGVLENLAVASLASLGAMLARAGRADDDPQPVTVVDEPVEVTPVKAKR